MTQAPELVSRDLIRSGEAAELLGVSVRTLKRWEDKGYLVSVRRPSGQRLYSRFAVESLVPVNDNGAG